MSNKKVKRKSSKRGGRSKGQSQSLTARLFAVLFSPLSFKLLLLGLLALLLFTAYLDARIRQSFEGNKWQVPARVYARPLELFVGLEKSREEVLGELNDLGYVSGSVSRPGSFLLQSNTIVLHSRGFQFWDSKEPSSQLRLVFAGGRIEKLTDLQGGEVPLARLEPIEIGAIYPSHKEDRILLKLEDLPPLLLAALVAVEDHRFYEHSGVSFKAIARAALANVRSGAYVQGGSTLTQQLVKNYYLTRERSLRRKFTEAIMSLLLEFHYEKEEILEAYTNEVYLGQSGARAIHGFGLGAQYYFNRPLHELSIEQLTLLIAVIRGPAFYDPWRYPERALERRNRILDTLLQASVLSIEEVERAKQQGLNLGGESKSRFAFPAFLDVVKRQLKVHYPQEVLVSEGLKIFTSLDPSAQRSAEQAVARQLQRLASDELQAAVVITEPSTGELRALVGGRQAGFAGFNRALDTQRSIGSVIKPFVYLSALLKPDRYTLATLIDDAPITIELEDGDRWSPRNFDRQSHGEVPLIFALANSYNQATARLGMELGIDKIVDNIERTDLGVEINRVPSLLIGTTQFSPMQVTQLYQSLSSGGYAIPIRAIRSVLDAEGNAVQRFPYEIKQIYDERAIYLLHTAMQAVVREGSGRAAQSVLGEHFRFAGKTGTSGQGRDAWFAGFSGDLLAVVWTGFDDNRSSQLTGSKAALPIWADIMLQQSRQSMLDVQPPGVSFDWVDRDTGAKSKARCERVINLPFIDGTQPVGRARCWN